MAVCVRLAAVEMDAAQVACVRFAGSFVVLVVATRARALRPRPGNVNRLLLRGLLGGAAITCYYLGIERAGAGLATLLHATHPIFTALFAVLVLGDAFSGRLAAALALSSAGAAVVLGSPTVAGSQAFAGSLFALLGGVLAGGALATASDLRRSESASLVTIWFMAVGALLTAPSFLAGTPPWSWPLALALVGVVLTSATGQWLLHHGLGFVPATAGSVAAATSVVTAAVLEAALFGERLGVGVVIGGLLMLAAVGMAARGRPRTPPDTEAVAA